MRKVIGIGETVLDIIFKNDQPTAAVPGGSVFNALISLGRSGVKAAFISETGNDRVGRTIINFLKENGVDGQSVYVYPDSKSPISLAFLNEQNDAEYIFYKDHSNDRLEFTHPDVQPDDIVLFGSYYAVNPVIRPQVMGFLDYARQHGAILYYDVNFRASHKNEVMKLTPNILENLELADIVRGSTEDFEVMFRKTDPDAIYRSQIAFYTHKFICTQGANPVELRADGRAEKAVPRRADRADGEHHRRRRQLQRRLRLRAYQERHHARRHRAGTERGAVGPGHCLRPAVLGQRVPEHQQLRQSRIWQGNGIFNHSTIKISEQDEENNKEHLLCWRERPQQDPLRGTLAPAGRRELQRLSHRRREDLPHRHRGGRLLHALHREPAPGAGQPTPRLPRGEPHGARPQRLAGSHQAILSRGADHRQQEDLRHAARLLPAGRRADGGEKRRLPQPRRHAAAVRAHPHGSLARDHDDGSHARLPLLRQPPPSSSAAMPSAALAH